MKLEDRLHAYVQSGIYPFHMPGHKRNPDFLPGGEFFSLDLTELEDTDDLHSADGMLLSAQRRAADLFSARRTYFCVGGSTTGILSAVHAMTRRGDKVLIARNCHRSVYNAVCLSGLIPIYVEPPQAKNFGFCASVTAESVGRAFEKDPDIRLAVITSPTYEGVISDIKSIAETVHNHKALLLVDSAHGAHLGFDRNFPQSPIVQGADVVIQSLHKTLPCFTQTALVHICTKRAEDCGIQEALKMYETSSPSYLLMCGIDNCIYLLSKRGKELFSSYYNRLEHFYRNCSVLNKLSVFSGDTNVFDRDSSKIVISTRKTDINGRELYYELKDRFGLQLEMYTVDSVLAVTSFCDTGEAFMCFSDALAKIDRELGHKHCTENCTEFHVPKVVMSPCEALESESHAVYLGSAQGEIAAEFIYAYPPGIPILVPGEEISAVNIKRILWLISAGVKIQGQSLSENGKINVIKTKKLS